MDVKRLVMLAIVDCTDDLMLGLACRCGCGGLPVTDHYLPAAALEALAQFGDAEEEPTAVFGMPVRYDATLCAPGEVWIERSDGTAVRVWPPE